VALLKDKVWQLVKLVWLILVLGVAGYYLITHFEDVRTTLGTISLQFVLLSVASLSIGKLFLTELSRRSIEASAWKPTFREMFCINSLTQLAKYIPGGVWHFVGRMGAYRASGLSIKKASKAMVVENLWLVLSAFLVGALLSFSFIAKTLVETSWGIDLQGLQLPTTLVLLVLWIVALWFIERFRQREKPLSWKEIVKDLFLQVTIWLFIGCSFFVLTARFENFEFLGLVVGGFCLSWAIGYLTVFAPGGLGAREAVLVGILASVIPPQDTIILAAVHRIIWVVTELLLGGVAGLLTSLQPQIVQKVIASDPGSDSSISGYSG
jgi:uncharacterized membrane protein YbhN (UPF0104 family)